MKLDTEKLKPWLDKFWNNPPNCIVCENDNWGFLERIWELVEYWPNSSQNIPTVPIVALVCSNCGYIISFSAIALEVVKKQEAGDLT